MSRCDERLKVRVEETCLQSHIHWVARQNKLEIPNDEEEVNTREMHKCDWQAHDPDTMTVPQKSKPLSVHKNRSPCQDTVNHCLTSWRRRCAEEVAEATVMLREIGLKWVSVRWKTKNEIWEIYIFFFIYYESTKRKLKTKYICECRCYERLQTKTNEFTRLSYTELVLELEHLKIETRLITEMFVNVMGECEN